MSRSYLDHAATTDVRPAAISAIADLLSGPVGNPSGAHASARHARRRLDEAREQVAALVGRAARDVIFTSGGTEADDLAIGGFARDGVVVCAATEHHAVLDPVVARAGRIVAVTADGHVDLGALAAALDETVSVVSVMLANNETGRITDLDAVAEVVREHAPAAVIHTDAVQAAPWLDLATAAASADAVSVSAHKLGGPMGAGALVLSDGVTPRARTIGGGQERELRAGTQNLSGIVGFGAAVADLLAARTETADRVRRLRDRLERRLLDAIADCRPSSPSADRLPNICHLVIDGVEGESLLVLLDQAGVDVSVAASCASGAARGSHVLAAMGFGPERSRGGLRLSLGWSSTEADVDRAVETVPAAVERLRSHARRAA